MPSPGFLGGIQSKSSLLEYGYRAGFRQADPGLKPKGLLFAGMGGSGAAAALVRDAASRILDVPLTFTQHHEVPHHVQKGWHTLSISYSGDTEETLEATRTASRRGCAITAFTTGGALGDMADRLVIQPSGYQPRVALAHAWFSVLGFLAGSGILKERVPWTEAVDAVRAVDAACGPHMPEARNEAKALARRLQYAIPQIFTTPDFTGVGTFFASLLNENAKKIAEVAEIPECNHNALTGWSGDFNRADFTVLVLSSQGQRDELTRRIEFMQQRYVAWGVPWLHRQFGSTGTFGEHVVQQARALQMLDYTSYYAAEMRGVDPAEIDAVRGLKHHLRALPGPSPQSTQPRALGSILPGSF